jgi:hypothetical protein
MKITWSPQVIHLYWDTPLHTVSKVELARCRPPLVSHSYMFPECSETDVPFLCLYLQRPFNSPAPQTFSVSYCSILWCSTRSSEVTQRNVVEIGMRILPNSKHPPPLEGALDKYFPPTALRLWTAFLPLFQHRYLAYISCLKSRNPLELSSCKSWHG